MEKVVRPTQADTNEHFCPFQFSVKYGNFGNLARPSWDFQFRGVPDSRKGCEITAWSSDKICNQATTGKTSLQASCLYIRNGKLDTKWRSRETKSRKENSRTSLDGKFIT